MRDSDSHPAPLPALTSLRFLAAIWVVLFHHGMPFLVQTPTFVKDVRKVGYAGVSFFFLLSGFVLAYNYLPRLDARTFRARGFLRARIARIVPLYLVVLAATLPAAMRDQPLPIAVRAFMLQAWRPEWVGGWNLPAWSVSAEAFFYLAFPLLLLGAGRVSPRWLLPAALGAALLALVPPALFLALRPAGERTAVDHFTEATTALKMNPLVRLPDFFTGLLLGVAYVRLGLGERVRARPWLRRATLGIGAALVVALVESRRHVPWELLHDGLFLVPFALVVVALSTGEGTAASLLSYRTPVFLGEVSYGVYLLHVPLHDWMEANASATLGIAEERLLFPLYLLALVALASVLHVAVERPPRAWLRRPWGGLLPLKGRLTATFLVLPLVTFAQVPTPAPPVPKGPAVLVFLAKGCPCNVRCMGELNRLSRLLPKTTPLVGFVVGGSALEVPSYRKGLGCAFPLRFDPQGQTALRAKAVCGLDLVLLDASGKPVKLWEGIGQTTVADLGKELVQRFHVKAPPDPSGFSEIVQTGCPLEILRPKS